MAIQSRIVKPRGVYGKTVEEVIDRCAEIMGANLAGKITPGNSKARCARIAKLMVQTKEGVGFDLMDREEVTQLLVDPEWAPLDGGVV